ncbi:MAG: prephenate dehydratase [Alphaproteobacteria bacterium]|nr:prephenate dehydratase [Alphaproteobacteria bacterium]
MSDDADPAKTISFQGIPGAYSHLACHSVFPDWTALPCPSFDDAFAAVQEGRAARGMIPIDNSLGGRVADIHKLLPDAGLFIVGEHFQSVQHHLVAPKGATLQGLKRVHSHVQALTQCREFIRELGLEPVNHADTAGAAADVAAAGDPTEAAIASSLSAEIYGLDVLRSRIEDRLGNTTRFIIMARSRMDPDPQEGRCVTAFLFEVRSVPAALYKALGGFATNGVNMTKLESYIKDAKFTVAEFYAEIDGHPAHLSVARAFEELQFFTSRMKVLGAFKADAFREHG